MLIMFDDKDSCSSLVPHPWKENLSNFFLFLLKQFSLQKFHLIFLFQLQFLWRLSLPESLAVCSSPSESLWSLSSVEDTTAPLNSIEEVPTSWWSARKHQATLQREDLVGSTSTTGMDWVQRQRPPPTARMVRLTTRRNWTKWRYAPLLPYLTVMRSTCKIGRWITIRISSCIPRATMWT